MSEESVSRAHRQKCPFCMMEFEEEWRWKRHVEEYHHGDEDRVRVRDVFLESPVESIKGFFGL